MSRTSSPVSDLGRGLTCWQGSHRGCHLRPCWSCYCLASGFLFTFEVAPPTGALMWGQQEPLIGDNRNLSWGKAFFGGFFKLAALLPACCFFFAVAFLHLLLPFLAHVPFPFNFLGPFPAGFVVAEVGIVLAEVRAGWS